jgi:lipid A ethanolaminephosphotransferase
MCLFAALIITEAQVSNIDIVLADYYFNPQKHSFAWRHTWFAQIFMHAELKSRAILIVFGLLGLLVLVLPFTQSYVLFTRQHKYVRMYANPTFYSYSIYRYLHHKAVTPPQGPMRQVAGDAQSQDKKNHHELVIMVVGETVRFDRFL